MTEKLQSRWVHFATRFLHFHFKATAKGTTIYDYEANTIDGNGVSLSQYRYRVFLKKVLHKHEEKKQEKMKMT